MELSSQRLFLLELFSYFSLETSGIFVKVFLGLHLFPSRQLISLSISGFVVTPVKCVGYFSFANYVVDHVL